MLNFLGFWGALPDPPQSPCAAPGPLPHFERDAVINVFFLYRQATVRMLIYTPGCCYQCFLFIQTSNCQRMIYTGMLVKMIYFCTSKQPSELLYRHGCCCQNALHTGMLFPMLSLQATVSVREWFPQECCDKTFFLYKQATVTEWFPQECCDQNFLFVQSNCHRMISTGMLWSKLSFCTNKQSWLFNYQVEFLVTGTEK